MLLKAPIVHFQRQRYKSITTRHIKLADCIHAQSKLTNIPNDKELRLALGIIAVSEKNALAWALVSVVACRYVVTEE